MNKTNKILVCIGLCSSKERQMIRKQTNTQACQKVTNAMKKRTVGDKIRLREAGVVREDASFFSWPSSTDPRRFRIEQKLDILRTE